MMPLFGEDRKKTVCVSQPLQRIPAAYLHLSGNGFSTSGTSTTLVTIKLALILELDD